MPKYPKHCLDSDFTQLTVCNSVEEVKGFCGSKGVVFQKRHFNGTKLRFQCSTNNRRKDELCNMIIVAIQQDTGEFYVYSRGEHNHPVICRTPRGTTTEKSDRLNGVFRDKYSIPESCRHIGTVDSVDEVEKFRKAQKVYCAQKTFNGEKMRYQCSAWKTDCKYSVYCIINEEGKYQLYERGEHNHSLESGAAIKPKAKKSIINTTNGNSLIEKRDELLRKLISAEIPSENTDSYASIIDTQTEEEWKYLATFDSLNELKMICADRKVEAYETFQTKTVSHYKCKENSDCPYRMLSAHLRWKRYDLYERYEHNHPIPDSMVVVAVSLENFINNRHKIVRDTESSLAARKIINLDSSKWRLIMIGQDISKDDLFKIYTACSVEPYGTTLSYGAKHNTLKAVLHYCVSMLHSITKASGLTSKCSYEIISVVLNSGECQLYETGNHDHLQKIPQNLHGRIHTPRMVDKWQYLFELKTVDALSKLCTNRKVRRWHKKKNTTRDCILQRLSYRCTSDRGIRCPYKIMTVEFMPQRFKVYQIGEHIHPMPSQLPYALLFPERLFIKPNGVIMDSAPQNSSIQGNLDPEKAQKPYEAHENFSSGSSLGSADVNTTKESREIEPQVIDSAESVKTQRRSIHNSANYPPVFDDTDVKGFIRDAAALDVKIESQIYEDRLTASNIPDYSRDAVNDQYGNNLGNGAQSVGSNSWNTDVKLFLSDCAQVDIKLEKQATD